MTTSTTKQAFIRTENPFLIKSACGRFSIKKIDKKDLVPGKEDHNIALHDTQSKEVKAFRTTRDAKKHIKTLVPKAPAAKPATKPASKKAAKKAPAKKAPKKASHKPAPMKNTGGKAEVKAAAKKAAPRKVKKS